MWWACSPGSRRGSPAPSFFEVNAACARPLLALDKVRFVGDPVALVVAATRAQAVDAAELVDVDYDPLPVVVDMEEALATRRAPAVRRAVGSNVARRVRDADDTDPLAGPTSWCALRMENQRIAIVPMEGNAMLVQPTDRRRSPPGSPRRCRTWRAT